MMDYRQTIDYLYHAAPLFQNIGAGAYKEGLANTRALDEHFGHPHTLYRTIHVAGTNGKGSVSSSIAAVLQSAGLRVGLYTSPHLVDFRERIRVNGKMIPKRRVIDFVRKERAFFEPLSPSFFELTTALAFLYFAEQQVDVAVVEVGLGGRLDCTNIITPDLSIITNISFDHQQLLGDTLPLIAAEKAGIIKVGVPVIIGETNGHSDVREVFLHTFQEKNASPSSPSSPSSSPSSPSSPSPSPRFEAAVPEVFPSGLPLPPSLRFADEESCPPMDFELKGKYQRANLQTIQCALSELRKQPFYTPLLTEPVVRKGLQHVTSLTGLQGRWQQLQEHPTLVCDAGHNVAGIKVVVSQLLDQHFNRLRLVFGMVNDKDFTTALHLLEPLKDRATYYFTQPSCKRALPAAELAKPYLQKGFRNVRTFPSVSDAVAAALADAAEDDFIFVGGSCYVVADLLEKWQDGQKC